MRTFVLIHGALCGPWGWHLVAEGLTQRGHDAWAPALPSDDDAAGFDEYADSVAGGGRPGGAPVVVVGHSMGSYTAALVAERIPTSLIVLVAPMIPLPGEGAGEWWDAVGQERHRRDAARRSGLDPDDERSATVFFHDLPAPLARAAQARAGRQSATPFSRPWSTRWPSVPTRVILFRDDRLLPIGLLSRLARERLGVEPDVLPGGHMALLSRPDALAAYLDAVA